MMGTRNLTIVVVDGKNVVAQYGQWDGYPEGQGATALDFCRERLSTPKDVDHFKSQIATFGKPVVEDEMAAFLASIGSKDGWLSGAQSDQYKARWPGLSRDHGADILNLLFNTKTPLYLRDETAFAADSLFCEWAYVIDIDAMVFEVYKGFNTKGPPAEGERFAKLEGKESRGSGDTYYPVRLAKKWRIGDLPSKSAFIDSFKDEDEDAA